MGEDTQLSRLKKIINTDTFGTLNENIDILKSDINKLLNSYFELEKDAQLSVQPNENGDLIVSVTARAKRVKPIKIIS